MENTPGATTIFIQLVINRRRYTMMNRLTDKDREELPSSVVHYIDLFHFLIGGNMKKDRNDTTYPRVASLQRKDS